MFVLEFFLSVPLVHCFIFLSLDGLCFESGGHSVVKVLVLLDDSHFSMEEGVPAPRYLLIVNPFCLFFPPDLL